VLAVAVALLATPALAESVLRFVPQADLPHRDDPGAVAVRGICPKCRARRAGTEALKAAVLDCYREQF
jgi:hypothetical protein